MRINLFIIAAFLGYQADAREVALQDFSNVEPQAGVNRIGISPNTSPLATAKVVSAMQRHFESADGSITARWTGAGYATNRLPAPSVSGFEPTACAGTDYAPTWWLPRQTEARRARYFSMIVLTACEFGIPANLLDAVVAQESGYKPWAVSNAGAMGLMQLMPGTAHALGLTQPFDPVANMRAGARYLRQQIERFGRIDLALAAYNAGPERRSLQSGFLPAIPETRNYVRTITANWARLALRGPELVSTERRAAAAMTAIHASGYRSVELIFYDGANTVNPT